MHTLLSNSSVFLPTLLLVPSICFDIRSYVEVGETSNILERGDQLVVAERECGGEVAVCGCDSCH